MKQMCISELLISALLKINSYLDLHISILNAYCIYN